MVYAADRKRTVLFGGESGSGTRLSDTWEWDSTHWTHVQDVGPAREGLALAFTGSATVLFGGLNGATTESATVAGDTWAWDGSHWVEVQDMGPQARWLHAMAFDSARNRLALFGGTPSLARDNALADTWEATVPKSAPGPDSSVVLSALSVQYQPATQFLTGQLTLSGPAPPDLFLQLSCDHALVGLVFDFDEQHVLPLPLKMPVPGGAPTVSFHSYGAVDHVGTVTFTATFGGVTKTASVDTL
jgi:hypothetical protein